MAIQSRSLEQLQLFNVRTPAVLDAAGDSAAVDLGNIDGDVVFILSAAASAASTGMSARIEHATTSGGTYAPVTGGSFADLGATASTQRITIARDENRRFYRLSFLNEVGNFSAAVSCVAVGTARYEG